MTVETKFDLTEDTLTHLRDLIQINVDSVKGFHAAAEEIEDARLASLFREIAAKREENANELMRFAELNGESEREEGSYAAAFHRAWLNLRSKLNGGDAHVILCEAERGEDSIKHAYEDALKSTAGSAMNDVLTRQYANVKAGHDKIRDLRDSCKS